MTGNVDPTGSSRRVRVLMAIRRPYHEHGGVERVVREVTREWRRQRPDWDIEAVPAFRGVHRVEGLDGVSDVIAALLLGWRVSRQSADVVVVHCPECVWGLRLFGVVRRTPVIVVWHGAGPQPYLVLRSKGNLLARALAVFRTTEERRALRGTRQVAVHPMVRDDLRSIYGWRGPVTVIENALDPETMQRLSEPPPFTPPRPFTAVWVGQAGHRKGLDVALEAVALARREVPDLRLIVAGVPAGPLTPGIEWRGIVEPDAVVGVYHAADALVFPTRYESFGLVVVEAMAAGLPVVTSDAVPPGIVEDGRNGRVVAGHDPAEYAKALVDLALDPDRRATVAQVNRVDAQRFSLSAAVEGYTREVAEAIGLPLDDGPRAPSAVEG